MQEDLEYRSVALSIKAVKLTCNVLAKAMAAALRKIKKARDEPHGRQTVKQLVKQNAGVSNIEINDGNIKGFERVARKYGVDFALKKDASESPPRWLVFFKARDADALTAAFNEFSRNTLRRARRPSVLETIRNHRSIEPQEHRERGPRHRERGERSGPDR